MTTSTLSPGVVTVVTSVQTEGIRPCRRGVMTMAHLAPAAVSGCPPCAPVIIPSEPTTTLQLKCVSTSRAAKITKSSLFTTAPLLKGLAYSPALILKWRRSFTDSTAARSKSCVSRRQSTCPLINRSHMGFVSPPTPNRIRTFLFFISLAREIVEAMEAPPTPVW